MEQSRSLSKRKIFTFLNKVSLYKLGRKQTKIYSINNVPLNKKLVFLIYLIILNKKERSTSSHIGGNWVI